MRRGSAVPSPLSSCPVVLPIDETEVNGTHSNADKGTPSKSVHTGHQNSTIDSTDTGDTSHNSESISPGGSNTTVNKAPAFDVAATIRTFKLFEQAPEELIDLIMARMRSRLVERGDEICREGEDAKAMYWIIRGSVAVVSRDGESKFAELHSGQFFGYVLAITISCLLISLVRLESCSPCPGQQVSSHLRKLCSWR